VEPGGAIELHAAFHQESRTSLPSVSATLRKSGGATSPFVVFSQGKPLLATFMRPRNCETALKRIRGSFDLCVYGCVVMPEHVHLLTGEPPRGALADAIKSLKQGVSRRLIGEAEHFWQKRHYDLNIRNHRQFAEELRYIHRNPVKRGLCERPEDWDWSSFRITRRE
jgi:putative transposase